MHIQAKKLSVPAILKRLFGFTKQVRTEMAQAVLGGIFSGLAKIGIARALLSDADYIVFDEATSSVDAASEEDIWNCIHSLSDTKTLLIISHRLSTVRHSDMIYVMRNGRVAESGDHDRLIAMDGIYARMVREQDVLENYGRRAG